MSEMLNLSNNLSSEVDTENVGVGAIDRAVVLDITERTISDGIGTTRISSYQSEITLKRAGLADNEAKLSKLRDELNGYTTSVRTATHEINRLDALERDQLHEVRKAEDELETLRMDIGVMISRGNSLVNIFSKPVHGINLLKAINRTQAARDNVDELRRNTEAQRSKLLMSQQDVNRITLIVTGQIETSNELRKRIGFLEAAIEEEEKQMRINQEVYSKFQDLYSLEK